jgi:hypothetical protein
MKMKRLDQFMDDHQNEKDIFEPSEGHLLRFHDKLNKSRGFSLYWIASIAAVLIVAGIISVNMMNFNTSRNDYLSSELKEAAWYYNSQSDKLISEIQANQNLTLEDKQLVLSDIRKFDKEYKSILTDLKQFPEDERLINAFYEFHRSRTEFLEEVLTQINAITI